MTNDSEKFDVVVVGAGPSGAVAARGLALRGRSVLLVEKQAFPRPKVCGCCLNRSAIATLEAEGLAHVLKEHNAVPLRRMQLRAGLRRATLPLPGGVSLSRSALDGALVKEAARAGVVFRDGVSARVEQLGFDASRGHTLRLGETQRVTALVVIVADGLGGTALADVPGFESAVQETSRVGLGGIVDAEQVIDTFPRGELWMVCGRQGYVGAVRLEDGSLDVAAAVDREALRQHGGAAGVVRSILRTSGVGEDRIDVGAVSRWRITPALTRARKTLAGQGIFVVGDAAGYVEPFTGEGMAWALAGGAAVVDLADAAVTGWSPEQAWRWHELHRRRVRSRQWGCRALSGLLRRPGAMRGAVGLLSWCPTLAGPITARVGRPASCRSMNITPSSLARVKEVSA